MNLRVSFESVLELLQLDTSKRSGNITCPFCGHKSFKIYDDEKGKCHTKSCGWYGDAMQIYCDIENVSKSDAYKELSNALILKKIKLNSKELTRREAIEQLSKDLEFLAWVRMYFAFYNDRAVNQKLYADKCGVTQGYLSKILNGEIGNIVTWNKVITVLKNEIPMNSFKYDLKIKNAYFRDKNKPNEEHIKKYMRTKKAAIAASFANS